jgi:hypothetical protein
MKGSVSDRNLMLEEQGRRVFVTQGKESWVLTIVHLVDVGDHHELRLTNRDPKSGKPDLLLTQEMWNVIEPTTKVEHCHYVLKLAGA